MNDIIISAIIGLGIILWIYLMVKYLDGDYSIIKTEEVDRNTYTVYNIDFHGNRSCSGKETRIVYKITYGSNKIKYKTKKYKH